MEREPFVKVASTADERRHLAEEASTLRALAHPAVVRLLGLDGDPEAPDRLLLQRHDGGSLAGMDPFPPAALAGAGAAVATVLADIHDLGYVHGDVRAEHVLLDDAGRPVLCGFGRARRLDPGERGAREAREADLHGLVRLLVERLPPEEKRLHRVLRRWGGDRPPAGGARALAAAILRAVPGAYVGPPPAAEHGSPPPDPPVPAGRRPPLLQPRLRRPIAAGVAVALAGAAIVVSIGASGTHRRPGPSGRRLGPKASAPAGVAYLLEVSGGTPTLTAAGRWGCGPLRPAVLDTASGWVWMFTSWPAAGASLRGVAVARIRDASGLEAVAGAPGCDRLLVLRRSGPPVALDPAGGS